MSWKNNRAQLNNDYKALKEESYAFDEACKKKEEAAKMKLDADAQAIQERKDKKHLKKIKLQKFKKSVKDKLTEEAFQRIFDKCLGDCIFTSDNTKEYSKSLVCSYVAETGADTILRNIKCKSLLLSELADCIQEAYDSIMEDVDPDDENTFDVNPDKLDNFFDDLDMSSFDDVSSLIKTRVNNASSAFVQKNINDRIDLNDSMRETKEKIENLKQGVRQTDKDFEEVKESYMQYNRRRASKISERPRTLYEQMVYTASESIIKDNTLRENFSNNDKLNMDAIVENVNVMYTFLEMLNTLKIEKIDEAYIENMLEDMKN